MELTIFTFALFDECFVFNVFVACLAIKPSSGNIKKKKYYHIM